MTDLASLIAAHRKSSDAVVEATKVRFQRGEIVHWMRRDYRQRGEVNSVLGFDAYNLRLRVLNTATGKIVDLYLYEIEEIR